MKIEINLIFLIKPFRYMTKKSRQKFKYLGNKNWVHFSLHEVFWTPPPSTKQMPPWGAPSTEKVSPHFHWKIKHFSGKWSLKNSKYLKYYLLLLSVFHFWKEPSLHSLHLLETLYCMKYLKKLFLFNEEEK